MQKERWHTDHLPDGYPKQCGTEQLRNAIQGLNDEYVNKTRMGKNNVIWERLISTLIKSGNDELAQRTQTEKGVKGVYFRVGGDMINDGTILTDRDAIVDIEVAGKYKSKKGKIAQGKELVFENKPRKRFSMDNPLVWFVVSLILAILLAVIWYWGNRVELPLKFGSK